MLRRGRLGINGCHHSETVPQELAHDLGAAREQPLLRGVVLPSQGRDDLADGVAPVELGDMALALEGYAWPVIQFAPPLRRRRTIEP